MKVGFIGIGQMGVHMSQRIGGAGHELVVHDSSKEAAAAVLARGAAWADSPREVAERCRVVVSCLPTPRIVEEVALGPEGLEKGWRPGDVYIDMSTNSPSTIRRIAAAAAAYGVQVLDAPVSGGARGAELGTLTVMVGGSAETLERVRPVLEPMAQKIFLLGEVGCGNVAKLVNNMIGLTCNSACAEGFVLGVKAGIDPKALYDLMTISTADNWSLRQYPNTVFKGNFEPGFKISLANKDIGLALELGEDLGLNLPVADAVRDDLAAAVAEGRGDKGVDGVILSLEEAAGIQVRVREEDA
jgi:3-hydroxyisobutyrate dehydrogenase-like beta-hydroxyacid dehydrogenase